GAAQLCAVAIHESDRRRLELPRHRRLRVALGPMASGAILLEQLLATRHIRRLLWAERYRVSGEQMLAQGMGCARYVIRTGLGIDERFEAPALGDKRLLARPWRQRRDLVDGRARELAHLGIFRSTDHLAVANRAAIIDRDIVEQ